MISKKSVKLIILLSGIVFHIFPQEFVTTIHFADSKGNTDSIIVGYDPVATDSVDTIFGEVNIIEDPLDSVFDVRITDELQTRIYGNNFDSTGSFHLKKQIVEGTCDSGTWIYLNGLDIYCKHWPVTAQWDSSVFKATCRKGSVLTSVPPGGWWDVGSPSDLYRSELADKEKVIFSANWVNYVNGDYAYINENQDTISVFFMGFGDKSLLTLNTKQKKYINEIIIYPNPTNNIITINSPIEKIKSYYLYNLSGELLREKHQINNHLFKINLQKFSSGIYLLKLCFENQTITKEILIQ